MCYRVRGETEVVNAHYIRTMYIKSLERLKAYAAEGI